MITSFHGEHRWLSNFWPATVTLNNFYIAPTVEHAYQAAKAEEIIDMLAILKLNTPGQAKRATRKIKIRKDWDAVKVSIMRNLLEQKFQIPELAEKLIATGDQQLIEGNTWGDKFWGAVLEDKEWVGENRLGKMLMEIRSTL